MTNRYTIYPVYTLVLFYFLCYPANAANVTFTPRLSIEEEYTSNFFLTSDQEEHDFSTLVTPGFFTELSGKTGRISLSYDPTWHYYANHTDYNMWSHRVDIAATERTTRTTTIHFSNSFLFTSEPVANEISTLTGQNDSSETSRTSPAFDSSSGSEFDRGSSNSFDTGANQERSASYGDAVLRRQRETYYTNSTNLGLIHRFGQDDIMQVDYTYTIVKNDDSELEDNQSHNPSVMISHWIVPSHWRIETQGACTRGLYEGDSDDFTNWQGDIEIFNRLTRHLEGLIRYSYSTMDFDGDVDMENQEEDYQIHNPSIGFRYNTQDDTMIRISAGYYFQVWKDSGHDSGFIANCDLIKSWNFRQASIRLTGSSGYDISYLDTANLGLRLYYGAGINANYRFTRNVEGYLFSTYQLDDYPSNVSAEGESEDRKDNSVECGIGCTWQVLPWLSSRMQASSRLLKSTLHENDFIDNRVLLNLTISPSQPYRI